jgi:general secretion pathway protein B
MSTILKALQKVEGKRQPGEAPLPKDLSLFEKPESRRYGTRALLLLLAVGMLIGAGAWQAYNRLTIGFANSASPGPVEGDAGTVPPLFQGVTAAVSREPDVPSGTGSAAATLAEGPSIPRTTERSAVETVSGPRVAAEKPSARKTAAVNPAAGRRTLLVVSGIAYQEDQAGRLAVVNDRPVGEGEEIDGAVVTAILEDRVRFSREGKTFEIGLATEQNPRK